MCSIHWVLMGVATAFIWMMEEVVFGVGMSVLVTVGTVLAGRETRSLMCMTTLAGVAMLVNVRGMVLILFVSTGLFSLSPLLATVSVMTTLAMLAAVGIGLVTARSNVSRSNIGRIKLFTAETAVMRGEEWKMSTLR